MAREKVDWFEIWKEDRESMLNTMVKNMTSDLEAGYNYIGKSITEQREAIDEFKRNYEADLDHIGDMYPNKVQHWCYIRLVKLGAI